MYKILIDSSKRYEKSVKVVDYSDGSETVVAGKAGDLDIPFEIGLLLEENDLKISDISEVVPNLGPGSFTGLKIGVTVANIINWACGNKKTSQLYLPQYGGEPNIDTSGFN